MDTLRGGRVCENCGHADPYPKVGYRVHRYTVLKTGEPLLLCAPCGEPFFRGHVLSRAVGGIVYAEVSRT